ncbi:hypothetical protein BO78DRAFT_406634 [Aspergillus sclerotiicarbonarius CBS 121057]|uniref:Protein kinase domain-containing protein n=1 Tax=Aspergillus sclerotiicarbonarius (strain CBS 121057 / IBT 28362) TaxID=1448318 RepID=A0A319ECL4_ASPSB|nr:hypothetical protein BO78DRAFT_406634 [Aspergillus sclerotiicarbonarius CBS 121057]
MTSRQDKHLTQFHFLPVQNRDQTVPPGPHLASPENETGYLKKRRVPVEVQQSSRKVLKGQKKDLVLPGVVHTGTRAYESFTIRKASPWDTYRKVYDESLAVEASIVIDRTCPSRVHVIRSFKTADLKIVQKVFRVGQHQNIISVGDCFEYEGLFHVIHEHLPVCLDSLVACPVYPDEMQLASILGQILAGICYIESRGLHLPSLSCAQILLGLDGEVKLGRMDLCDPKSTDRVQQHMHALGLITMELMEGDSLHEGAIGVKNLTRWPSDSDAVQFLSATTSADSLEELQRQPLLSKREWDKSHLVWLVLYTLKASWNNCTLCDS